MKHLDLFSGYGGFALAAQSMGWETIGFSEIDKYASSVLRYNFRGIKNYGNVCEIDFKQFNGEVDIISGGTPCVDLSVAGKRKGLAGKRSGLFFEFIRAITESRPKYFLWENVKGALSSNGGWDFARIQIEMEQAGYEVRWAVLNAKDYGVPQNRERVFIFGARGGCKSEILRIAGSTDKTLKELTQGVSDACRVYNPSGVGKSLKALGGGLGAKTGLYSVAVLAPDRVNKRQNGRRFKTDGEPNFTLTGQDRHGVYDGIKIRRLTPLEAERLMGLPDNWTKYGLDESGNRVEISDTQRYKMCGNGVVVPVIEYIYQNWILSKTM